MLWYILLSISGIIKYYDEPLIIMTALMSILCKINGHRWNPWTLYTRDFEHDVYYRRCLMCGERRYLKLQKGEIPLWLYKDLIT
jgi:hypothetical protein